MTSKLVDELLLREGLRPVLDLRERGVVPAERDIAELFARSDVLALGAAADVARRRECGDETRIHVPCAPSPEGNLVVVGAATATRGGALVRQIASLRLAGPIGRRIVVDFGVLGLEVAQVALSFGATDLAGPIASRRGLPLVDREDQKKLVKRLEIAGYVERAGFRPVFVTESRPDEPSVSLEPSARAHVDS
jgi:hypothetical protein